MSNRLFRNESEAYNAMRRSTVPDTQPAYYAMGICPPCNQDCNQGRTCPTRQACALPEEPESFPTPIFRYFGAAVALVVVCAVLAALFAGPRP